MKTNFKYLLIFTLFAFFTFNGCQDENAEIDNPSEQETIVPDSELGQLINGVIANFGAVDDILDGSSCFSVELPVTIVVSDVTIIIENSSDLEALEDLFEEFNGDSEDFLEFVFPITIIFSDYTELVIENEDQLENFINECEDDDDTIECVDFVYPVSFSIFNSDFNLIDTVVIESDEALYDFLEDLEDDENALIVSLDYPVSLVYVNGDTIEVNSNLELGDAIEAAEENCDDDDEDTCSEEELALNLLECPWDFSDGSGNFDNYQMIFHSDGSLQITDGDTTVAIGGLWNLTSTDNGLIITLFELTAFQDILGGEWLVVECENDELEIIRGDISLELNQNCEDDSCTEEQVRTYLKQCSWEVSNFNDINIFSEYELRFKGGDSLLITNENSVINATWTTLQSDSGVELNLSDLDFLSSDFEGEWLVTECDEEAFEIINGDVVAELERDCEQADLDCPTTDLWTQLTNCAWTAEGNIFNPALEEVYFYFSGEWNNNLGALNLSAFNPESNTEVEGAWSIDYNNQVSILTIHFDNEYQELSQSWVVTSCVEGQGIHLVNGEDELSLYQDCNIAIFDCFVDTELTECAIDGGVLAEFNLTEANEECGLYDIYGIYYFESESDAENFTNPITATENYINSVASQVIYAAIINVNGNVVEHIFTITLNVENCNIFDCFGNYDLALCDEEDGIQDGFALFDLNQIFSNCPNDDMVYTFHSTLADAENDTAELPSLYTNTVNPETIYSRVSLAGDPSIFEIFSHNLIVEDCSDECSEADVDAFLLDCIWNISNYNGDDNLMDWNFDFESSNQTVVIYTNDITIDATWSTSQSDNGVIIEFSNVSGPNIQVINGSWLVVECTPNQLVLHDADTGNSEIVLERTCE